LPDTLAGAAAAAERVPSRWVPRGPLAGTRPLVRHPRVQGAGRWRSLPRLVGTPALRRRGRRIRDRARLVVGPRRRARGRLPRRARLSVRAVAFARAGPA